MSSFNYEASNQLTEFPFDTHFSKQQTDLIDEIQEITYIPIKIGTDFQVTMPLKNKTPIKTRLIKLQSRKTSSEDTKEINELLKLLNHKIGRTGYNLVEVHHMLERFNFNLDQIKGLAFEEKYLKKYFERRAQINKLRN